jgi:predicted ATPase
MLRSFSFKNFKSFREATLRLAPLTLLIGTNASGKSNAREAIQILSWLSTGRRLDDIFRSMTHSADVTIRGRPMDLVYKGLAGERPAMSFTLACTLCEDSMEPLHLEIELRLERDELRVSHESLSQGQEKPRKLYWVEHPAKGLSHDIWIGYDSFKRGTRPQIPGTDQQAVFTQLATPARFLSKHAESQKRIPEAVELLRTRLGAILFLDPNPSHMRGYSFKADRTLKEDGATLSGVLHHLCKEQGREAEVLDFIRCLPEQDILGIDFLEGPRTDVIVTLTESFGGVERVWDATVLSDGTLRVLAVAAALLSTPEQSLVVIEEIDNGVHPSRARLLLDSIQRVARARKLHVLLTTHNPALLDVLPLNAVPDVLCCYRDPLHGDSRVIQLRDLPSYPQLMAQGPLGGLVTRGVLERMLKERGPQMNDPTRALEWLKTLDEGE